MWGGDIVVSFINLPYLSKRSNELYHHGILGQKWGVRRYQNPDGSLTAAGKARYEKPLGNSSEMEKAYKRYRYLQGTKSLLGGDHSKDQSAKVLEEYHNKINKEKKNLKRIADAKGKDEYKKEVGKIVSEFLDSYATAVLKDMNYNSSREATEWLKKQYWFGMPGADDIVF